MAVVIEQKAQRMKLKKHLPMFVTLTTAAALFEMSPKEFERLVNIGALPRPYKIADYERWDADELQSVVRGEPLTGFEDVTW